MNALLAIIKLLLALLILGYVGINFMASLPTFLVAENLLYALLYGFSLYGIYSNRRYAYTYTSVVAAFNAGRVSRSIIGPTGEIAPLALDHLPLFAVIATVTILSAIQAGRGGSR